MPRIHSIHQKWKSIINNNTISENLPLFNHRLIKYILHSLEKLNSKEIYFIQMTRDFCKPTSQMSFEKHFNDCVLHWKYIYILPCVVTSDTYTHYVQYEVLINMLYLNEKLFSFRMSETSQCSFYNRNNETIEHFFCHCFVAKALLNGLNTFFENHLSLYDLTPQALFFGFTENI